MLDVVVPCSDSDVVMLYKSIPCIRENVEDGVGKIYIVGSFAIKDACEDLSCEFVDELALMGFSKHCLVQVDRERRGWVYQQLIKLSSDKLVETDDFLVCDSDHVLLKPHRFVDGDKYIFYTTEEYHKPYFDTIKKILGDEFSKIMECSFISDKMVFNKEILKKMKKEIEVHCGNNWIKSIISACKPGVFSCFSEFETYGTYIRKRYKDVVKLVDANRKIIFDQDLPYSTLPEIKSIYAVYHSLTQGKKAG